MTPMLFIWIVLSITFFCLFWGHACSPGNIFGAIYDEFAQTRMVREYTDDGGEATPYLQWDEVKRMFFTDYSEFIYPIWIVKPLVLCVPCFAGFYGSLIYLGFVIFQKGCYYNLFWHFLICCVASGCVKLLWTLITYYERH